MGRKVNLKPFIYWIKEREMIRIRKEEGCPPPWTKDPILQNFRFCNVRREDDRVTVWIRENIREKYADHPNLFFMLCVGRLINWPPTLQFLMDRCWPLDTYNPHAFEEAFREHVDTGRKTWTGAYLLGRSVGGRPYHFAHQALRAAWEVLPDVREALSEGLQAAHTALKKADGWGNFLAYQVVVDARFTSLLSGAPDAGCWAAAGPGTCAGLQWLHDRDPRRSISQQRALEEMLELEPHLREAGVPFDFSDIPNILCEGSKYLRMQRGGRMRSRYQPLYLCRPS